MKRAIMFLAVLVVVAGCAMWQKAPVDDPNTSRNEAEDHAAKVRQEEGQIEAGAEIVKALVPPPFDWVIPLITQAVFGVAAMRRR